MLENSGSETQSHVSGHRDDLIFMTAVALKPIAKGINACSVLPRLDVEYAFANQISEDGDVVLAFLAGLIHPQSLYIGYVNMFAGKIHVFFDEPPQAGVCFPDRFSYGGDGLLRSHEEDHGLEEQSKTGTRSCPWNQHRMNPVPAAMDSRHVGMQESLVLKKVEVPPSVLDGVMNRAGFSAPGNRTREPRSSSEFQPNMQGGWIAGFLLDALEFDLVYVPRFLKAEGNSEKRSHVHDSYSR